MAVVVAAVVKAVWASRNFHFAYFPHFRQQIQIPIDGGLADSGVLLHNFCINLIGSGMALELIYRIQDQRTLNRIAVFHLNHP